MDISTRRIPDTSTTVLAFIQEHAPYIKNVVSTAELDADSPETNPYAVGGNPQGVAFLFKNDPRKLTLENPMPFYQYPLQVEKLETIIQMCIRDRNEYKRERHGDSRLDDSRDLDSRIRQMLQEVSAALEKRIAQFGLDSKIQQIAKMTQNTSVREWKRAVKDTLGIDILDDYYSGELYEQAIQRWIAENVAYIKSCLLYTSAAPDR